MPGRFEARLRRLEGIIFVVVVLVLAVAYLASRFIE